MSAPVPMAALYFEAYGEIDHVAHVVALLSGVRWNDGNHFGVLGVLRRAAPKSLASFRKNTLIILQLCEERQISESGVLRGVLGALGALDAPLPASTEASFGSRDAKIFAGAV